MLNWKPRLLLKLLTGELSGMWMESCVHQDSDQWQASRVHFVLEGSYSYTSVLPCSATKSYWYWNVPNSPITLYQVLMGLIHCPYTLQEENDCGCISYSFPHLQPPNWHLPTSQQHWWDVEYLLQAGLPLERCTLTSLLSSQERSPLEHRLQVQPRHQPLETPRQVRLRGQTKKLHTLKESIA